MASHHDHSHVHDDHRDGSHASGHNHGHGHAHVPKDFGKAFAIGVALNTAFLIIEAGFGFFGNSVALLADAGHNLGDVLGLIVAWTGAVLARRIPTARYTYGLRGSSILAALANAVFLLVAVGGLSWEALQRFGSPEPVKGGIVMGVAAAGVVINGVTAWLFVSGSKNDINLRGAFLHMLADAIVSAGVIVAGLVILLTGWNWLDPAVSLVINLVIIAGTWSLLRDSLRMSMAAVPDNIDPAAVRAFLLERPGVASLHDLHIWPMSTTETALTCHLVMPDGHPGDHFLHDLCADLAARFSIHHPTLQIEVSTDPTCAFAPDDVV